MPHHQKALFFVSTLLANNTILSLVITSLVCSLYCVNLMKLILIDFDDTISCSSWLTKVIISNSINDEETFKAFKDEVKERISFLENKVLALLDLSLKRGKIIIVSNAESEWYFDLSSFFL